MKESVLVIYNNKSGTDDNSKHISQQVAQLENHYDVTQITVKQLLDHESTKALVEKHAIKKLLAIGGDGTVNASLKAAVELELSLYVIPNGTFNHFAKHINLSSDIDTAFEILSHSTAHNIDIGKVNDTYFINFASIGFYAELIAHRIQLQSMGGLKWRSFFKAFTKIFFNYLPVRLEFEKDGTTVIKRTPLVFISNNAIELGSLDMLHSRKSFDSGVLQLIIIKDYNRFYFMLLGLMSLFFDTRRYIGFETLQLQSFTISSKRKQVRVVIDGEIFKLKPPLRFSSEHNALKIHTPS